MKKDSTHPPPNSGIFWVRKETMGDSKRLRLVVVVVPGGFMVGRGASELEDDAR